MNKVFKEKGSGKGMKVLHTLCGKNPLSLLILLLLTLSVLSTLNVNITSVSASIPDSPYIAVVPDTIVDETLTPSKNFTVSIYTDYNGSDVWGWQFTLTYNPLILQGVNVTNGDLIHPDKSVYAMFEPGGFDNVAGKLSLTVAYFFFQPPYVPPTTTSGPGTLANVTFTVVGTGTSDITLGPETKLKAVDHDIIDAVMNPNQIGHGFFANIPLPPVADANGPYSGYEGTPITFDATGSTDLDGTIDLYEWDWNNNGTYDESTASPTINHTWPDDRTGTVGLRVTDDDGQTHTNTASVTVNNVAPTVNAGPDRVAYVNQIVNFSGSFTDPGWLDTHTIFWDFGDGSNASGTLTTTHVYTEARVYTVTLNVTDDDAGVGLDTLNITVSTVPVHDVAILSVTPNATKVVQGSAVNITVVAFNEGTETESFNITAYANTAEIGTEEVIGLAIGTQTTLSFIWDTTGFSSGNYTIKAVASVVLGEIDTDDNTFVDGTVQVQGGTLDIAMDVGSIHFKGEMAEFYIIVSLLGEPTDAEISAILYYNGTLYEDLGAFVEPVATGVYRVPYAIPTDAPTGTYVLVVKASYLTLKGASLKSFLLNPTLTGWNALLISIDGAVGTIKTDVGLIEVKLDDINAKLVSVEGNIATISSTIGLIQTDISTINGKLTAINGTLATIQTDIGLIQADITDIQLEVTEINGNTATIQTTLGTIEGTITSIEEDIATIETDVGTVKTDISKVKRAQESFTTPLYIAIIPALIAAIGAILAIVFIRRKPKT